VSRFAMVALLAAVAAPAWAQAPSSAQKPAPAPPSAQKAQAGQKAPAPQEKPFPPVSESVEVSVTNVDVVVTDSKGHRVTGLKPEDFEIRQDGILQKITNFYAAEGGKVLFEDGKSVPLSEPAAVAEVPPEVKAHYVFYIDNLNIQAQNRNRMFRRLKQAVPEMVGPNAEGMIVTFNRSVKVRRPFTSDASDLVGALEQIEYESAGGTTIQGERRDAIQKIDESTSADEALGVARMYSLSLRNDLDFTVNAIKATLDSLAGLQGRKYFIYVSEGLPETAGLEMWEAVRQKYQDATASLTALEYNLSAKYATIISAANANGVTIYTLDASGLSTGDLALAENPTIDVKGNEFFTRQNMQAPIRLMAEQTGGIAAVNTNDWKSSLDEIAADFSNFYSLGYRSAKGAADRPHKIEVTVNRKGVTVRTRSSFVEKSVETRTAEAVLASLHYPRTDNPLRMSVSVGDPKPYGRENYVLPVRIAVPIGRLGLVPSGEQYEGHFFVYFVVLDASEKQSDLQIQRQEVKVPAKDFASAQHKDFYYDVQLIVVPGGQKLAVAVRDGVSNLTSFAQKNVFVSVLPKSKDTGEPLVNPSGR
jgi:VWFA-related protein